MYFPRINDISHPSRNVHGDTIWVHDLFVLWPPSMINGALIGVELITFVALLRQIEGFAGCKYGPAAADTKRQGKTKNVLKK